MQLGVQSASEQGGNFFLQFSFAARERRILIGHCNLSKKENDSEVIKIRWKVIKLTEVKSLNFPACQSNAKLIKQFKNQKSKVVELCCSHS